MVGLAGFEPTASCTPCKRATRLRHSPKIPMARHRPTTLRKTTQIASAHSQIQLLPAARDFPRGRISDATRIIPAITTAVVAIPACSAR